MKKLKNLTMVDLWIYALIGAIISFYFMGCKNVAYNRVSTDTEISARNKKVLLGACDRNFPQQLPIYVEGQTIYKTDSFFSTDSFTITQNDTIIKTIIKMEKYTATATRHDTIYKTNTYHEIALNDQIRAKDKEIDKLTNQVEAGNKTIASLRIKMWLGWIVFIASVILVVLKKIYLK